MKKLKDYKYCLVAPIIIIFILLSVYFFKGIYPFGSKSIICADLGQSYLPWYYYIKDVILGSKSILYSFNLGLGSIPFYGVMTNSTINPLTLLLVFVERSNILNFINIFLIIKLCLCSITSFIFYKKVFPKINNFWIIIFSLLYGMNSYIFTNYHNIIWLDILIIFPLLVLSIKYLFEKGKCLPYIILLTLTIINSYYISYMIILFIIFCGSTYIYFFVEKEKRKEIMLKSLFGTLISLGLSLVFLLPVLTSVTNTYRYISITETSYIDLPTKMSTYFGSFLSISFVILYLVDLWYKDKKKFMFFVIIFLILMIGIFLEPINKMWHGGNYRCFPYRYGFIPLFVLSTCALSYFNDFKEKIDKIIINKKELLKILGIIILFLGEIFLFLIFKKSILSCELSMGIPNKTVFFGIGSMSILFFAIYMYALMAFNNKIKYIICLIATILELSMFSYLYIGMDYNIKGLSLEHTDTLQRNTLEVKEDFDINNANFYDRYKDTTASFDENYAYIMDVPTISNWTHMVTTDQLQVHTNLGYSYHYTKLQDTGGTLFSDAFYHIKYIFSKNDLTENVYLLVKEVDNLKLYETNTLNFGIIHKSKNFNIDKYTNTFDYQNKIYQDLFNKEDNIIEIIPNSLILSEDKKYYEMNVNLDKESALYLNTKSGFILNKIEVNDNVIYLPTIDNSKNTEYHNVYYNGNVDLGTYVGNVNIKVYGLSVLNKDSINLGYIELDKYNSFIKENSNDKIESSISKNELKINVTVNDTNNYLFIPLNYYEGMEAYVNNKKVDISKYLNVFINIPLEKGENEIIIKCYPKYLKAGIFLSLLTLGVLIVTIILNTKFKLEENKLIQNIGSKMFTILVIITYLIVYVYAFFR